MNPHRREQIGPMLRRLRQAAGWSQAKAADELCRVSGRATITKHEWSRWETGRRSPTEYLADLADLFDTPLAGLRAAIETTEIARRFPNLAADAPDHTEDLRRRFTAAFTAGVATAALDDWEATVQRYGRATRDRPAALLAADLTADLSDLHATLDICRSATALRSLSRITAHMSGLMCLTLIKLGDRQAFRGWARTARIAAAESGDSATLSWVLAEEAYGHYYAGDMAEAVHVATAAQDTAGVGAVLAAALAARAHAAIGDQAATTEAIGAAESLLERLDGSSVAESAFGYNEAQLRFHEGNAFTHLATHHLADTAPALTAQDRALELYPAANFLDRALVHLDRAACLTTAGDSASGTEYALSTLQDLTDQQRQGIITARGHEILDALPTPQQALPSARDLRDLLMTTTNDQESPQP
ncbi:helix-turn-helix domain-containing protein [Actinomadura xylanilytica]|uniref:helix-turn-helix domain-containing protein n=1 Tax=Actinomadura xylanilytica TaxID=887459 RepID=UPI00255AB75B|nr:helix-turn-helix transcriptional regulator [Actinomadura xylanilytica]MDL4775749.1 helix-turn-helix transcriptional regulator [Actinomadura xylanilytica]